jgi:hypothetical protein
MAKEETLVKGEVFGFPVETALTEKELLMYGDELATLDTEESEATARHQSEKGRFKADIETIHGRRHYVLDRIRTKREMKEVECYNDFDYFEGICTIRRVDNDEKVSSRKMSVEEFKGERLPFPSQIDDPDDE